MAPALRSQTDVRKAENKEDITHVYEEIWGFDPDETFYKSYPEKPIRGFKIS